MSSSAVVKYESMGSLMKVNAVHNHVEFLHSLNPHGITSKFAPGNWCVDQYIINTMQPS